MTGSRRRLARLWPAVTTAAVLALSGCGEQTDLGSDAAAELQVAVRDVAVAAAEGRYDAATTAAAEVRAALDRAADEGAVSVGRYRAIDDALTRTEAELAAAQQAAAEAAAAEQAAAAAAQAAAEAAAAEQAAAEAAAAEEAARQEKDDGNGNRGKGRGDDD